MAVESKNTRVTKPGHQKGFTLLQLMIVVLVIAVIGGMAAFGIVQARQRIRLTNSARLIASHLEKARVDSIRRHAVNTDEMGSLTFLSNSSYRIRYDMDGNGTLESRDIFLDNGIVIVGNPVPTRFDWRGRFRTDNPDTTRISITLQYGTSASDQRTIDVTRSGDVTIDSREYLDDVPNVNVNSNLSGIDSGSTVNGNTNPSPSPSAYPSPSPDPNPSPNPSPSASPSPSPYPSPNPSPSPSPNPSASPSPSPSLNPSPSPSPSPAPCVVTITPTALSIRKNVGVGDLSFAITGGSGAVSFANGPSNLQVTQTSTYNFQVTSLNNSRGDFTLYFSTPCGSRQVTVSVTN
ncbi:MAG: pilus assembly FimT family protein [Pyrinomonadaceae bacterium]